MTDTPKFRVGDRVCLVDASSDYNERLEEGHLGTVLAFNSDAGRVTVSWDGLTNGHNGDVSNLLRELGLHDSSCWHVRTNAVKLVVEEPPAEDSAIVEDILKSNKVCLKCQNFVPLDGCDMGFCKSWHNFCTKNESCSRCICG